jgi:hypothetical protein
LIGDVEEYSAEVLFVRRLEIVEAIQDGLDLD